MCNYCKPVTPATQGHMNTGAARTRAHILIIVSYFSSLRSFTIPVSYTASAETTKTLTTMKVTSNLSLLLCIISSSMVITMPAVKASTNVFRPTKRSSMMNNKGMSPHGIFAFNAAVQPQPQSHRDLQSNAALEFCEAFIEQLYGANSGCTCEGKEGTFVADCDCKICDTLQGKKVCLAIDSEAEDAIDAAPDSTVDCFSYKSGPFDNTICEIETVRGMCAITIDGDECSSCTSITCTSIICAVEGTISIRLRSFTTRNSTPLNPTHIIIFWP